MSFNKKKLSLKAREIMQGIESILKNSRIDSLAIQREVSSVDAVALSNYFNSRSKKYYAEVGQEVGALNHILYVRRLS